MNGWRFLLWLLVHPSQWAVAQDYPAQLSAAHATQLHLESELAALKALVEDHNKLQALLADQARLEQLVLDQARLDELIVQQIEVLSGLKTQSIEITELMASIRTVAIPKTGQAPQIRYPRTTGLVTVKLMDANMQTVLEEIQINARRRQVKLVHGHAIYQAADCQPDGTWRYRLAS